MGDTPFLTRCQEAAGGTEARVSRELTRQTPWLLLHLGADSSRVGKPGPSPFPVPRLSNYIFLNLTRTLTHCPTGGSPMPLPWVYVCMNAHAPCRHSGYGRRPVNPLAGQSPSPARISAAWRPSYVHVVGSHAPPAAACRWPDPHLAYAIPRFDASRSFIPPRRHACWLGWLRRRCGLREFGVWVGVWHPPWDG